MHTVKTNQNILPSAEPGPRQGGPISPQNFSMVFNMFMLQWSLCYKSWFMLFFSVGPRTVVPKRFCPVHPFASLIRDKRNWYAGQTHFDTKVSIVFFVESLIIIQKKIQTEWIYLAMNRHRWVWIFKLKVPALLFTWCPLCLFYKYIDGLKSLDLDSSSKGCCWGVKSVAVISAMHLFYISSFLSDYFDIIEFISQHECIFLPNDCFFGRFWFFSKQN